MDYTPSAENSDGSSAGTSIEQWSMREEILRITHQWPQIILFCIAGCLLGWIIAWLRPTNYRAAIDMYVGLSIYQVESDRPVAEYVGQEFKDFIDYKNWQMTNLNGLVLMDQTLNNTLAHLRSQDSYWNQVSTEQLRTMLDVHWRSAGKWRLEAESNDPLQASQAVFAWQTTILEQVDQAIEASRSLQELSLKRQANAVALTKLITSQAVLARVKQSFEEQLAKIQSLPQNLPVEELDRWLVWQTVTQAELGPTWLPLADSFPGTSQPASSYVKWLEKAIQASEQEIQIIQDQIASLEAQNNQITSQYTQALEESMGLSANLEIRAIENKTLQEQQLCSQALANCNYLASLHSTSSLMLVGGGLGLLGWCLVWSIRISQRGAKENKKAK